MCWFNERATTVCFPGLHVSGAYLLPGIIFVTIFKRISDQSILDRMDGDRIHKMLIFAMSFSVHETTGAFW
jgi:hypothetical protein